MNLQWLKARQTRYGAFVTLYILIVLGVLSIANFLANRHNKSYDSTSNKRFSLSDQTTKVVSGLQQDVKITLYDQAGRFQAARDLLDRYDNLSAKLSVDYVDPDKKPAEAKAAGVSSYGTIYVEAASRKEEAKSVTEEEITGALIRALKGGQRSVCVVSGSGEHSLDQTERTGYSNLKEVLEKNNYSARTISLLGNLSAATPSEGKVEAAKAPKPEVPKDCTVLVVAGPRYDYLDPAVNAIKEFVEGGGSALIMLDPPVSLGREDVSPNPALVKLLESWGVTLEKDIIVDTSGIGQLFQLSAVVPLVTNYESHAIVRDMKEIATAFPLVRSLDTKSTDKTTVDKLFSTSTNSYSIKNLTSAEIQINPSKDKKGPFSLAAAGTYNTGKENTKGRFVVAGSSGWVANNLLRFNGNRDLFLNMVNWLSADEDLISIRPKEPEDRRLNLTRAQMSSIFYATVIGLPLMVVAAGLGVWWRRR